MENEQKTPSSKTHQTSKLPLCRWVLQSQPSEWRDELRLRIVDWDFQGICRQRAVLMDDQIDQLGSEFESLKAYPVVNGGSALELGVSIFPSWNGKPFRATTRVSQPYNRKEPQLLVVSGSSRPFFFGRHFWLLTYNHSWLARYPVVTRAVCLGNCFSGIDMLVPGSILKHTYTLCD